MKLILQNPGQETHIVGVTESWLDSTFRHANVKIKGYTHERVDREERTLPIEKEEADVIIVYIDKDIPYIRSRDLGSNDIGIQLCPPKRPVYLICFAYRNLDYYLARSMDKLDM